jgi:fermentation-respiration switch protein FrsA (DUF1100 family)
VTRRVLNFLLVALLLYSAWLLLLFIGQRQLIYLSGGLSTTPGVERSLPGLRAFRIPFDGGEVDAWFVPPVGPQPAPAMIFTHGNAELIDHAAPGMAEFAKRGLGVLLVEYPGYGRSSGRPSFATIEAVMLAAYDWLAEQPEVDRERIVAYGRSLGGGPAAALSLERPLAALVFQSAFTSLRPYAARYLAPGFLVRDRFEVLEAVREFSGPVLLTHGRNDVVVPHWHGEALAGGATDATLDSFDCGHNDCPPEWGAHVERVVAFLTEKGVVGSHASP